MQSLLSGSTNLCDECAVSRSRQPICLPPSAPPSLLVSIGYPLFQWTPFVSMDNFPAMFLPLKCCFNCLSYSWHRASRYQKHNLYVAHLASKTFQIIARHLSHGVLRMMEDPGNRVDILIFAVSQPLQTPSLILRHFWAVKSKSCCAVEENMFGCFWEILARWMTGLAWGAPKSRSSSPRCHRHTASFSTTSTSSSYISSLHLIFQPLSFASPVKPIPFATVVFSDTLQTPQILIHE